MNLKNIFNFKEKKPKQNEVVSVQRQMPQAVKVVEVGTSGTEIYAGYIDEEYLHDLKGSKAMKIYDKMRRSDPRIKMVLSAVKNPIKSADWTIEAMDETPQAEAQKKLIERILFDNLGKSWKKTVNDFLSFCDFGHAEIEVTHKAFLKDAKIGPHIGLKSLKLIGQKTVEKFNVNPDGTLKAVTQYAYGDLGKTVDIPAKFLLHFAIDKEGDNYEGVSMLRPCYGPWLRKNNALKQESVGNQNYSTPIAVMSVPDGEQESVQYKNALQFLQNYANNMASYLVKPVGWDLELINNTFDSSKIRETIKAENEEIAFAFLANFLNLGSGSGGSYALSNDLSDFFSSSLEFIADELTETLNIKLIPMLVKLNFANQECLVKIKVSGIADKAGKEFAEVIELLTRSKALTPDFDLEQALRKKYKLPEKVETISDNPLMDGQAVGEVQDVQVTAFNGAQISSMIEIVQNYKGGVLDHESAIAMVMTAFNIDRAKAEVIVGPQVAPDRSLLKTTASKTFAEKKISVKKENPQKIADRITGNANELRDFFKSNLKPIANKLINDIVAKYESASDTKAHLAALSVDPKGVIGYEKALTQQLYKITNDAFNAVADNYKFADKKSMNRASTKAKILSMTQINDLEKAIYLQYGTSVDSTDSSATLRKDLTEASDKAIETMAVGADITSAQLENETRFDVFEDHADEIESFTFYNNDPVSDICQSLNESTFAINDPDLERYMPPLHHNCKSVMVPNLKGDQNNPSITGLPSISEDAKKSITLCDHKH